MGKIKLCYWEGVQGRGAAVRYLLEHAGADYEQINPVDDIQEKYLDKPFHHQLRWRQHVKPKLKESGFHLVNIPYIIADDATVSCMFPCMAYVAEKFGYNGSTIQEKAKILNTMDVIRDMTVAWFTGPALQPKMDKLEEEVFNSFAKFLIPLENEYKRSGTEFIASQQISQADIHFFEVMSHMAAWHKGMFRQVPLLRGLFDKLMADPKLKAQHDKEMSMPMGPQFKDRFDEMDKEMQEDEGLQRQLPQMFMGLKEVPYFYWGHQRADGSDYFEAFYE